MLFIFTLAVVLSLASARNNYGGGSAQAFCRLAGTFTNTTQIATLTTFNTGSVSDAGRALCAALTPSALRASEVDCDAVGNSVVAFVTGTRDPETLYECRVTLTNKNVCKTKGDTDGDDSDDTDDTEGTEGTEDDDDRKRQIALPNPCNSYRDYGSCNPTGCSDNTLGNCQCLWDNPSNANGFPADTNTPCPDGQICCHNLPCSSFNDLENCIEGSRTLFGESNCEYVAGVCRCRAPLITETQPVNGTFAPYDCLCPFGAINSTASQCAAAVTPTEAQLRDIRRFNQRIGVVSATTSRRAFQKACKTSVTKVTAKGNDKKSVVDAANKYADQLRANNVVFHLEYVTEKSKLVAQFTLYPDDAKRAKSVAESTFTAEELEALEVVDVDQAAASSNLVVSLAAASIAVIMRM